MRKIIDIDAPLLSKLKLISAFENLSVKALIVKAVADYVGTPRRPKNSQSWKMKKS